MYFQNKYKINNIKLQETPFIKSIFFVKRWRCKGNTLHLKGEFVINALYQQTEETLVLFRSDSLMNLFTIQLYSAIDFQNRSVLAILARHNYIARSENNFP